MESKMKDKLCTRCQEREGIHEIKVGQLGKTELAPSLWYCDPCWKYLQQKAVENSPWHGHGCGCHTAVTVHVPPQPLDIPASPPQPKFTGDRPLPEIYSRK